MTQARGRVEHLAAEVLTAEENWASAKLADEAAEAGLLVA